MNSFGADVSLLGVCEANSKLKTAKGSFEHIRHQAIIPIF